MKLVCLVIRLTAGAQVIHDTEGYFSPIWKGAVMLAKSQSPSSMVVIAFRFTEESTGGMHPDIPTIMERGLVLTESLIRYNRTRASLYTDATKRLGREGRFRNTIESRPSVALASLPLAPPRPTGRYPLESIP